jgi:DNA-directed RNA polymerase specialized sigma24 family protein
MNDENILKELKIIKKLLAAYLYSAGVSSENISEITGMDSGNIRKLISKRKMQSKSEKNA